MDALFAFITNVLNPIGIVVGLLIAIPVAWTWIDVVFGRRRRTRRWLRESRRDARIRPALLMVDLLADKDVLAQMERHVTNQPELATIPPDRRHVVRRDRRLQPDDLAGLASELRARAADIARAGCDTAHCLYAGPASPPP